MQRNEILHMQVRLFRLACKEWNININRCADLFENFKINEYIKTAYEFFRVQGDEANLEKIEEYLRRKGVVL